MYHPPFPFAAEPPAFFPAVPLSFSAFPEPLDLATFFSAAGFEVAAGALVSAAAVGCGCWAAGGGCCLALLALGGAAEALFFSSRATTTCLEAG